MKLKVFIIAVLVLFFYNWVATRGTHTYHLYEKNDFGVTGYYNLLSNALIAGQLHLQIEPHKKIVAERAKRTNLYANHGLLLKQGLYDFSLYKGKVYGYFGVVPAITLYIPFQLLFKDMQAPDSLAILLFGYGSYLWSVATFLYIRKKYFQNTPEFLALIVVAVLGFTNYVPYLLNRPRMYEVAIASGLFFISGSLYFFCRAFEKPHSPSTKHLLIGFIFSGLAVGCRPYFALLNIFIFMIIAVHLIKIGAKINLKKIFLVISPYLLIMLMLGAYNYFRFNNFFEFGNSYNLMSPSGIKTKSGVSVISKIPPKAYFYLIHPPSFTPKFPYLYYSSSIPGWIEPNLFRREPTIGMLTGIPFIWIAFLGILMYEFQCLKHRILFSNRHEFPLIELSLIGCQGLFVFLYFTFYSYPNFVCMRYLADMSLYFLLSAGIWGCYMDSVLKRNLPAKIIFRAFLIGTASASIVFGMCCSRLTP